MVCSILILQDIVWCLVKLMCGMERYKECPRRWILDVFAACSFSRITANHHDQCELHCAKHYEMIVRYNWMLPPLLLGDLMVDRFGFLETPMFDRKDMADEATQTTVTDFDRYNVARPVSVFAVSSLTLHKVRLVQRGAQVCRSRIKSWYPGAHLL